MPAINVARTDTFEKQRVKINEIGSQIFNVTAGGSDLATGNLKLGDGTKTVPSLAFTNDDDTGFFRPESKTIGVISNTKLIATFNNQDNKFFNDVNFVKNEISSSFITINNSGDNYDPGTYSNVSVIGGSGINGLINISIESFTGSITNYGAGFIPGSYAAIPVSGGNGIGATINFQVIDIEGDVTNAGSSYSDGLYSDVPFTGGNGSGATFGCNVNAGEVTGVTISNSGVGYQNGDILSVSNADLGGSGGGFSFTITSNPGTVDESSFQFSEKGTGYLVNDTLTLPGAVLGVSCTLDNATTDITVTQSQADAIQVNYVVTQVSGSGVLIGGLGGSITVFEKNGTTITLSGNPDTSGSAVLNFSPAYGSPSTSFTFLIDKVGAVDTVGVSNGGSGYAKGDTLTVSSFDLVQPVEYQVSVSATATITFNGTVPTSFISVGDSLYIPGGVIQSTSITTQTTIAAEANNTYTNLTGTTSGSGVNAVFSIERGFSGDISSATITAGGVGYAQDEVITFLGASVGGSTPADNVEITVSGVSDDGSAAEVLAIRSAIGNITSLVCADTGNINDASTVAKVGVPATVYTVNTFSGRNEYFVDSGSGVQYHPDFVFYAGSTYKFNNPQNTSHPFRFSQFRDGTHTPSSITGMSTTLDTNSTTVTLTSTTGILVGMIVTSTASGGQGAGTIGSDTLVESIVDSFNITLTKVPDSSGSADLDFSGYAYTDNVVYESGYSQITPTASTPSPLYYYCAVHPDMGGDDNNEAQITIDLNNPKVFGSGFTITLSDVESSNIVSISIDNKKLTSNEISVTTGEVGTLTVPTLLTAPNIAGSVASINTINSSSNFAINSSGYDVDITSVFFNVGNLFSIESSSGNIETSGDVKILSDLNVNDKITIRNNEIISTSGNNLVLKPASNKVTKIDSLSALVVPVGDTSGRPGSGVAENGAIRFNTDNSQYEGYSASTSSWSSLGGVRDIDGNTYILAELTAGANDNTLWFYNDNSNTLKLTTDQLQFQAVKTLSSPKLGIPSFNNFTSNTPVVIGSYIKYRNNLYEVTSSGTTGGQGTEPIHLSGVANSGSAQLTFSQTAVSELIFNEVDEIRVGPNKDCPIIIGQELKLDDNTISTQVQDLIIQPNAGKQVIVNSVTHFRIPAGNDNQKSIAPAGPGSIRFNTDNLQFEGYSGANWSSLGGVRDVDGNTYIIPETSPAANENILYFYNNNSNTLQLTETVLDFTNIDTITTSGGTSLSLDTQTLTLSSNATTIDNTDVNSTFISTTKQYLDLGLSSGLNVDPVLRLDNQGDVYLNTTFGTGSFNGVKIFDGELKEFELADYKLRTATFTLDKGGLESSSVVLYPSSSTGCKVTVMSKSDSGKKSMTEYSVIDNGVDIFHNEYGSLNTSADQYTATFDFTASSETRITIELTDDHTVADIINVTVLIQEIK